MHLSSSPPFVRFFGDSTVNARVRRREPFELRIARSSKDIGSTNAASLTRDLLFRLLVLPVFIAVITMVIAFLGISWPIRAGQLMLLKVKSLLKFCRAVT